MLAMNCKCEPTFLDVSTEAGKEKKKKVGRRKRKSQVTQARLTVRSSASLTTPLGIKETKSILAVLSLFMSVRSAFTFKAISFCDTQACTH